MADSRSVPRLDPVTDPSPEVAALLAKTLVDDNGQALHVFSTLARHPRLLRRLNALGGLFVAHGELPARERELVVLRTAWSCDSVYEWGQHVLLGRRAGLSDEEIARVTRPLSEIAWSADDAALLAFVDELLTSSDVSEARWTSQRARWSDAQLVELVMLPGFYRMLGGFLNAFAVQPEESLPGWPAGSGR
jgi:4-carboxymuconolactone decarboxylase